MNTATVIDVWNQVVLPELMPQILAASPEQRQKLYEDSLQVAEDIWRVNGANKPAWAKAILKS